MDPIERKTPTNAIDHDSEYNTTLDDDEPTTEELVEMLRESLEDVKAGRTRPARELLRELREIVAEDADPPREIGTASITAAHLLQD